MDDIRFSDAIYECWAGNRWRKATVSDDFCNQAKCFWLDRRPGTTWNIAIWTVWDRRDYSPSWIKSNNPPIFNNSNRGKWRSLLQATKSFRLPGLAAMKSKAVNLWIPETEVNKLGRQCAASNHGPVLQGLLLPNRNQQCLTLTFSPPST